MKTCEITRLDDRGGDRLAELLTLWEASVRASHDFLGENDIASLKPLVWQGLAAIPQLYLAVADGTVAGFMGIEGDKLEMLFLHPEMFGRGLGKTMLRYATDVLGVQFVDVNEQNSAAAAFYQHCGFAVHSRSPLDAQGNPFPILHLRKLQKSMHGVV